MTDRLVKAMESEAALCEALLRTLVAQRDALAGLRTAEVETLAAQEEALAARVGEAGSLRRRAAAEVAERLGLAPGTTLQELSLKSGDARLVKWRQTLTTRVQEIARANDLNKQLAGQSLLHVRETLLVLTGGAPEPATYGRRGPSGPPKSGGTNLVDSVA